MTAPDNQTAFVQVNLEFHEARQAGEISGRAYCLGLHLACAANYVTKRVTASIPILIDDLEWDCSADTVRRHLDELREHGFVAYDVRPGERTDRRGYKITVTPRLVYDRGTSARPPQDLRTEGGDFAEVTSAETSADPNAGPDEIPGQITESPRLLPQHQLQHERGGQERSRYRKKEIPTTGRGNAGNELPRNIGQAWDGVEAYDR